MVLVMLTPGLACGGMMCANEEQAARKMPCHEMQDDGKTKGVMFFKDCAGIDLAQTDHGGVVKKSDVQIDKIVFAWANITVAYDFAFVDVHQIRGPPPPDRNTILSSLPLYLSTQRLRV